VRRFHEVRLAVLALGYGPPVYLAKMRSTISQPASPPTRFTTRPRTSALRTRFSRSVTEIAMRSSAWRLRPLRELGEVKNAR